MRQIRDYQQKTIDSLRSSLRGGKRRPMCQLPTGSGKTVIAASIIRMARDKGKRVAFIVDSIGLIDQTVTAFYAEGLGGIGVIQADHPMTNWAQPIQVASVQTLRRRKMPEADMVIVDEAHSRDAWLTQWMADNPKVVVIGLSATPWAKGLGNHYDDLIQPVSMQELIDAGYLCPIRVYAASKPDLSKVKTVAGEYHEGQLSEVMADDGLIADAVETWLALSQRRATLVFAVDCAHAQKLQERFHNVGIAMGYVDAYTERAERKKLGEALECGKLSGIVSVGTMIKGIDFPFVSCISDCAPTKSEMRHVQKLGRGMRIDPNGTQDCVVLDHASNNLRLGFPMDIHKTKLCTKQAGEKGDNDEQPPPKPTECLKCKQLRPKGVKKCPACGFEPMPVASKIEEQDGVLVEVKRLKPQDLAARDKWYQEALGLARRNGKADGWAWHMTKRKWGAAPREKLPPIPPSPEVISYARSQQIRYAKAKGAAK